MMMNWLKKACLDPEFDREIEFLVRVPLFAGVERPSLRTLLRSLVRRDYHKGEALCTAGSVGRALFLLERGKVSVLQNDKSGKGRPIATLQAGDYFGEVSLLDEFPRTATVVALEPVRAYICYKSEIEKLVKEDPEVGAVVMMRLAQALAARLRAALEKGGTPA